MRSESEQSGRMCLLDMHTHLFCFMEKKGQKADAAGMRELAEKEIRLRREMGVAAFWSSGTPEEWEFVQPYRDCNRLFFSFGIHPWYADRFWPDLKEAMDFEKKTGLEAAFRSCDAVGEIGMDNVWCDVPLGVQRKVFERQLVIAAELKKPVVLHTKGMEREIAEMIRDFPEPVCVHWYSGDLKTFERFLENDCYFTLGPDLADRLEEENDTVLSAAGSDRASSELYRCMLHEIPVERLFVETDGLSAVAWAKGKERAEFRDIPGVLEDSMQMIAEVKKIQGDELRERMWENLETFLGKTSVGRIGGTQSEDRVKL